MKSLIALFECVFALLLVGQPSAAQSSRQVAVLTASAGTRSTSIAQEGVTAIPNGRLVTPAGRSLDMAPPPFGLTVSQDGSIANTANLGTDPLTISVSKQLQFGEPKTIPISPGVATDAGVLESVCMGTLSRPMSAKSMWPMWECE